MIFGLRACLLVALATALAAAAPLAAPGQAAPSPGHQADVSYERSSAQEIRSAARQIMDQPQFRERQSVWERLRQKLFELLAGLNRDWSPNFRVIGWILFGWCVLALLAVLGHMIWSIVALIRTRRQGGAAGISSVGGIISPADRSFEDLYSEMLALARSGDFRHAISLMLPALVRWLDDKGALRIHPSKTSGDYAREYPPGQPGRQSFRQFTNQFDAVVYGGHDFDSQAYQRLGIIFEDVRRDAGKVQTF
jgi:hypothetical protein